MGKITAKTPIGEILGDNLDYQSSTKRDALTALRQFKRAKEMITNLNSEQATENKIRNIEHLLRTARFNLRVVRENQVLESEKVNFEL